MALKLGSLSIDIGADTSGLDRADKKVKKFAADMERSFKRIGKTAADIGADKKVKRITGGMEQPFKRIGETAAAIGADGSVLDKADKKVKRITSGMERSFKRAGKTAAAIGADTPGLDKAGKKAKKVSAGMERSFNRVGATIAAALSVESARRVLMIADNMVMLKARIDNLSKSQKESNKTFGETIRIANEVGVSINGTIQSFQRFSLVEESIGATNAQTLRFTETLMKLGVISGATGQEIVSTSIQIGQALTNNFESAAQEINSINEQLPAVARAVEKSLDLVAGTFKKTFTEGEKGASDFFNAILKASDRVDKKFKNLPKTIARATQELANNFAVIIGEIDDVSVATQTLAGGILSVSDLIGDISQSTSSLTNLISGLKFGFLSLFALFSGRGFAAIVAITQAKIALANKTRALILVQLNEAKIAHAKAIQDQAAAARSLKVAANDVLRAGAITRLAAANGVAIASQTALNVATANYAVVATVAGRATLFLKGAFAFLGGPVGVITIAAIALAAYVTGLVKAKDRSKKLNDEIQLLLGNFKQLKKNKLKDALIEAKDLAKDLQLELSRIEFAPAADTSFIKKLFMSNEAMRKSQRAAFKERTERVSALRTEITQAINNIDALKQKLNDMESSGKDKAAPIGLLPEKEKKPEFDPLARISILAELGDETAAILIEMAERNKKILEITKIGEDDRRDLLIRSHQKTNADISMLQKQSNLVALSSTSQFGDTLNNVLEKAGKERTAIGKAVFLAGKALQVATIIAESQVGAMKAIGIAGPFGIPLSKIIMATGFASAGLVAGLGVSDTFEHGGIVGGNSFSGDRKLAKVNSGEMILTRSQQSRLFSASNGGGAGGGIKTISVINSGAPIQIDSASVTKGELQIAMSGAVSQAVSQVDTSFATGRGSTARAFTQGFKADRNIRT